MSRGKGHVAYETIKIGQQFVYHRSTYRRINEDGEAVRVSSRDAGIVKRFGPLALVIAVEVPSG